MFKYLLLATFIPALFAFEQCSSGAPVPSAVTSTICKTGEVCQIIPGSAIDITAIFTSTVNATAVSPLVTAHLGGLVIEIDTPTIDDACVHLSPGCPLVAGTEYTYTVNVAADIPDVIPTGTSLIVELSLVNPTNAAIVCVSFAAIVA